MSNGTISAASCCVASVQTIPRKRAHPAQRIGPRRGRAPAHRLGPGKGADDRGDDLGDEVFRLAPRLLDDRDVELALLRVLLDRRVLDAVEARALEKALKGRLRRADPGPLRSSRKSA